MSYSANQYNYATPLSSSNVLTSDVNRGYQLFNHSLINSTTSNGVTITNLNDGGFTITGTATSYVNVYYDTTLPVGTYVVSTQSPTLASNFRARIYSAASVYTDYSIGRTFSITGSEYRIRFMIQANINTTYDGAPFYPMLNAGTVALPWEPYTGGVASIRDDKFFVLGDNSLDGSYYPVTGDVGLWGAAVSDANGNLSTPFVVTVEENLTVNAYRVIGSQYNYPVNFSVALYNGSTLLETITMTDNTSYERTLYLSSTLLITKAIITVTKISKAGVAVRLYNVYNPGYVKRVDNLRSILTELSRVSQLISLRLYDELRLTQSEARTLSVSVSSSDTLKTKETSTDTLTNNITEVDSLAIKQLTSDTIQNTLDVTHDTLSIKHVDDSSIQNTIDVTKDTLRTRLNEARTTIRNTIDVTEDTLVLKTEDIGTLRNIHSVMKDPFRQIYGKVYITYTDPMLNDETNILVSSEAYNSNKEQVLDGVVDIPFKYFTLYDNNLLGGYKAAGSDTQVGWTSADISDSNGNFASPQTLTIGFSTRPIISLSITFDDTRDNLVKNFTVTFVKSDTSTVTKTFTDNSLTKVDILDESISEVVSVTISITKVARANSPATIVDIPVSSTVLYRGYADESDLMSIDLLEELTYEDEIEALGGVSANEITVRMDNSSKQFFFNKDSIVSKQLKRNRKIIPYLGAEVTLGIIEWYQLGVFWSYKWDVPVNSLVASVVGFDTIGLLSTTTYTNHQVQVNSSIGDLIAYVLENAKLTLDFIEYSIDSALYDITIPYAWFEYGSHADALRKISLCYPIHIYCDRQGCICASPQKLNLDYYYDVWSDSTNVISKTYSSLYTALPNIINVQVNTPILLDSTQLTKDETTFVVSSTVTKVLNFSKPYLSDIAVSVDCDSSVTYTYAIYSWGAMFTFAGSGTVRSIECVGSCVDISHSTVISKRNEQSIRLDGAITRDVSSDFIQSADLANLIIARLETLSANDKYDASVNYRGDISLSVNDPILLLDGIAPDNRYNIKRHQLVWDGFLTGSVELNT